MRLVFPARVPICGFRLFGDESNTVAVIAKTDTLGLENTIALINSSLALSILIPSFSVSLQ